MKLNPYTSIIPLSNGYVLCYNALNDTYIGVHSSTEIKDREDILQKYPLNLREKMIEADILINDDLDVVEEVRRIIKEADYDPTSFILHINPTLDCNFNCWYCYEQHMKGSMMDAQILSSVLKFMEKTFAEMPKLRVFHIAFFGGEPLLGFDKIIIPVVNKLEELCEKYEVYSTIQLTTNGMLAHGRVIDYFASRRASFQITLDGHKAHHDKVRYTSFGKGSYDAIMKNIRSLAMHNCHVTIRINYTAENYISIPDIIADLCQHTPDVRKNITIDFQRVWQDIGKGEIDLIKKRILEYADGLRQLGYDVTTHLCHSNARSSCYGDKLNYVLINYDGGVFCCTARDFIEKNRAGSLSEDGTVIWKDNSKLRRMAAKFSKPICHKCRIAPLCAGGCCQKAIEYFNSQDCIYGYTEDEKDNIIKDRFETLYLFSK